MTVDWPESLDTGGTAIMTWIGTIIHLQTSMYYGCSNSSWILMKIPAYGNSTFHIEERSINNHRGSGRHDSDYTGESRGICRTVSPVSIKWHYILLTMCYYE